MTEAAPGALVELLSGPDHHGQRDERQTPLHPIEVEHPPLAAHPVPQRNGERHQQPAQNIHLFHRPIVAHGTIGHQQHRAEHRDDRHDGRQDELPGQRADFAAARNALALDRVLGGNGLRHLEPGRQDRLFQIGGGHDAGHVIDGRRFRRLVRDGANDTEHGRQRLLQWRHARRVMQIGEPERHARLAAVVAGGADGLDQFGDIRVAVVVFDGRLVGREVDSGGRHARRARERFLHRGGAARAGHPFDRQEDACFAHAATPWNLWGDEAARRSPAGSTTSRPLSMFMPQRKGYSPGFSGVNSTVVV